MYYYSILGTYTLQTVGIRTNCSEGAGKFVSVFQKHGYYCHFFYNTVHCICSDQNFFQDLINSKAYVTCFVCVYVCACYHYSATACNERY